MILKIAVQIFFVFFIGALQIAFISGLPGFFSEIDLIAIFLVFVLMFFDFKKALGFAVGFGLLLDFYTFYFFGSNAVALVLALFTADFLLRNFFTNRSFYSFFAMTAIIAIFGRFLYFIFSGLGDFFAKGAFLNSYDVFALRNAAYGLGLDFVLVALFLYLSGLFSFKLKPVFLDKKKYG